MDFHLIPDIDIRASLANRGLECNLITRSPSSTLPVFRSLLCAKLQPVIEAAYERRLTEHDLMHETWAVILNCTEAPHTVVACATMQFIPDTPCFFHTHYEAVHPANQGVGIGRLLFDCIAAWTRFLSLNDHLVLHMILRSNDQFYLVSTIDRDDPLPEEPAEDPSDNELGHGTFLKKLGFVRALHDFGQDIDTEIAFQRAFPVPLEHTDPNNC